MELKKFLIVVADIEKSKKFYEDLFGLKLIADNDGNMVFTDKLALQQKSYWEKFLGKDVVIESNSAELYFEEENIEDFIQKLETLYPQIKYVNKLMTHTWEQKVIRFYDLDGNLIEVGTPIK